MASKQMSYPSTTTQQDSDWDLSLPTTRGNGLARRQPSLDGVTNPSTTVMPPRPTIVGVLSSSSTKPGLSILRSEPESYWRLVREGSRWHKVVAERLRQLGLQSNYPQYPSIELLNAAWSIVDELLPPSTATPSVTPSEEGGVELFWQKRGWDLIVEISPANSVTIWTRDRATGDESSGAIADRIEEFRDILANISAD
jgi:hypothetical protein